MYLFINIHICKYRERDYIICQKQRRERDEPPVSCFDADPKSPKARPRRRVDGGQVQRPSRIDAAPGDAGVLEGLPRKNRKQPKEPPLVQQK